MRSLLIPLLLLSACNSQPPSETEPAAKESSSGVEVFASGPRDRLCLKSKERAGIITYAASGNANCSVKADQRGTFLIPDGETTSTGATCMIPFRRDGNTVKIDRPTPSCTYYCGPGASLEGKSFTRITKPDTVTDLAGDPLC